MNEDQPRAIYPTDQEYWIRVWGLLGPLCADARWLVMSSLVEWMVIEKIPAIAKNKRLRELVAHQAVGELEDFINQHSHFDHESAFPRPDPEEENVTMPCPGKKKPKTKRVHKTPPVRKPVRSKKR